MQEPAPNSSSFPTALCGVCDKIVLTCVGFNADDEEERYCVHCDSPIESELKWVNSEELEAEGYSLDAQSARRGGGGCGSGGCGTCATRRN
jgi:hypothetical protein